MKTGIDVSEHQGIIDWETAKQHIDFAMLRAGYGKNSIDKQYIRNVRECNRLDVPIGIYWFSYAKTVEDAHAEARKCLSCIKDYDISYPVAFDFEYDSLNSMTRNGITPTKELTTAIAKAFLEDIEAAGYYAMNYTNKSFAAQWFDASVTDRYDLWLASWYNNPDFDNPPKCGIWQWGGKAIPGIQGDIVDGNVTYRDYPAIIKGTQQQPQTDPYQAACDKLKSAGYEDIIIALADKIQGGFTYDKNMV